jgi:hypothetical protein
MCGKLTPRWHACGAWHTNVASQHNLQENRTIERGSEKELVTAADRNAHHHEKNLCPARVDTAAAERAQRRTMNSVQKVRRSTSATSCSWRRAEVVSTVMAAAGVLSIKALASKAKFRRMRGGCSAAQLHDCAKCAQAFRLRDSVCQPMVGVRKAHGHSQGCLLSGAMMCVIWTVLSGRRSSAALLRPMVAAT